MGYAKKHIPRLLIFFLNVFLDDVRKGFVASLVALNYLATLLVNYYNMIILVDYFHATKILHVNEKTQTSLNFLP